MVEIRSYTNVWKVERMLYGVYDWHLPRPVPYSTALWFGGAFLASFYLAGIPPFVFGSGLMNHFGIPGVAAWLMGRLKVDGKNPPGVMVSLARYALRPRASVRGKRAETKDREYRDILITIGRRRQKDEEISD